MTYRVKLIAHGLDGRGDREIVTNFAGCRNEDDAHEKARSCYPVKRIVWAEAVGEEKQEPATPKRVGRQM
jgi:hypothetical protein